MPGIVELLKKSNKKLFVGLAGPGTGKTTAFKTIIESNEFKDKNILILSFIKKLIYDLSEDFKDFTNVQVSTLHAFVGQQFGDLDLDENLDDIITEDYLFIEGSVADFEDKFYNNTLNKSEGEFYRSRLGFYKHEKPLYSFSSIIHIINKFFSANEDKIPNQYDLILIDEFQDFNISECELISFLNSKNNIVVVGDDDQSLYFFRKAHPEQIRNLYNSDFVEKFVLDSCYRCTEVIVEAVKDFIDNAEKKDYLQERLDKVFLYPQGRPDKDKISKKYQKIDFWPALSGDQLFYNLAKDIRSIVKSNGLKRVLLITPNYFKQTLYDGMLKRDFNVVEFEPFADEKCNNKKHSELIEIFKTLIIRKTDNLALRKALFLYLGQDDIESLIVASYKGGNKKLWFCLDSKVKQIIEQDIELFKKVRLGKDKLSVDELARLNKLFNLKHILSRMLKGFGSVAKGAIEIELTTAMSSKGLSADLVYYVGIDNQNTLDRDTKKITDQKIREFLVAMTRAKEKLTLISLQDESPKILDFIDKKYINKIEIG